MKKEDSKRKKNSLITSVIMKKGSFENMRKKERKVCRIALGMMRKKNLEKMIRKERWINIYKL